MDNSENEGGSWISSMRTSEQSWAAGTGLSAGQFHWSASPVPAPDPCRGHDSSL